MSASLTPAASSAAGRRVGRPLEELVAGIDRSEGVGTDVAERRIPERFGLLLAHHQHGRAAVGDRARVAGGEAAVALVEDRLQLGESLQRGVGADAVVAGDGSIIAGRRERRRDLRRQAAVRGGGGGPLVREEGDLVLGAAGDVVFLRHLLRRFAHAHAGRVLGDGRRDGRQVRRAQLAEGSNLLGERLGAARLDERARRLARELDRHVGQRLGTAGEHHVGLAAEDGAGPEGHGAGRRGARQAHRHPGDAHRQRGAKDHFPAEVRSMQRRYRHAEDGQADLLWIDGGASDQLRRRHAREIDDVHIREVGARLDERRPAAVDDRHPSMWALEVTALRGLDLDRLAAVARPDGVGALGDLLEGRGVVRRPQGRRWRGFHGGVLGHLGHSYPGLYTTPGAPAPGYRNVASPKRHKAPIALRATSR